MFFNTWTVTALLNLQLDKDKSMITCLNKLNMFFVNTFMSIHFSYKRQEHKPVPGFLNLKEKSNT